MPTYQEYRSYGHTRFAAWTLARNAWWFILGMPIGINVIGWGAAYYMGWL